MLLGTVELNEILGNLPIVTSTLKSIVQIYAMTIQSTADSLKGEAEEAFQRDLSDEISMTKSLVMLADVTDRMERKAESLIIHENVLDLRRKVLREERARERETCGNDVEVGVSRDLALAMSDVAESLGRVGSLLLSIAPLRLHQAIKYLEEALTIREQLCLSASRREDEQYESDAWLLLATSQCDLAEGLLAVASAKISVLKQFFDGVAIGDTNVRTYIGTADARTCAIAESSPTTTRRRHDYSEEEEIAPSLRLELLDRSQNLFEKSLTSRMRIQGAEHLATRRAANKQDVVLEMIKVEQLRDRIVFFSDTSERFPLLQLAVEKEADGRRKEEIFCKMELQGGNQRTAAYNIDETMTRNRMHSFSYSFSEDKYVPQQHDIILKLDPSSSCEKYSLSLGPSSLPHINVKKTRQCDDPSKAETSLYLSTGTISYDCSEKSHSSTSTPKNPISLKRFPSSSCSSSSPASRATSEREGKRKLSRSVSLSNSLYIDSVILFLIYHYILIE